MMPASPHCLPRTRIAPASDRDRAVIYRLRHDVYATELRQHAENREIALSDPLDAFNHYIVASAGEEILGFVSITPPGPGSYSIDKYFAGRTCRSRSTTASTRSGS